MENIGVGWTLVFSNLGGSKAGFPLLLQFIGITPGMNDRVQLWDRRKASVLYDLAVHADKGVNGSV